MSAGLIYEGVSTEPLKYSGGSAAQSSVLHAFDELLGIHHTKESGKPDICSFFFSQEESEEEQGGFLYNQLIKPSIN
jgi:hypothetical protein